MTKQLSIRITEEEYAQVEHMAVADERLLTDVARRIFRRGLPLEREALQARGVAIPADEGEGGA